MARCNCTARCVCVVDGTTITGAGTEASPFVASGGGGETYAPPVESFYGKANAGAVGNGQDLQLGAWTPDLSFSTDSEGTAITLVSGTDIHFSEVGIYSLVYYWAVYVQASGADSVGSVQAWIHPTVAEAGGDWSHVSSDHIHRQPFVVPNGSNWEVSGAIPVVFRLANPVNNILQLSLWVPQLSSGVADASTASVLIRKLA